MKKILFWVWINGKPSEVATKIIEYNRIDIDNLRREASRIADFYKSLNHNITVQVRPCYFCEVSRTWPDCY